MTDPQDLRDHADRIEADDIPAVRAAALLREAANAMQGFYDTREERRAELERLYAVEKDARPIRSQLDNCHKEIARLREELLRYADSPSSDMGIPG